ncbi:MAG TPA: hypothetical protein VEI58_10450 [Chthoniobacterales bacterium]|nr:hypothetical protein [Chthoniobacterales bacterium]
MWLIIVAGDCWVFLENFAGFFLAETFFATGRRAGFEALWAFFLVDLDFFPLAINLKRRPRGGGAEKTEA